MDSSAKIVLAEAERPASLKNPICGTFRRARIVPQEADQPGPKGRDGCDFITLPALILLPDGVQASCGFRLCHVQNEPSRFEVLPKGLRLRSEALLYQPAMFQGHSWHLNCEVTKGQSMLILFLSEGGTILDQL